MEAQPRSMERLKWPFFLVKYFLSFLLQLTYNVILVLGVKHSD